ncbi:MAG: response regulator [Gaiella sp.]
MSAGPVRVVLVEDNEIYRSTLELLLGQESGIEVVGAVGEVGEALSVLSGADADVAVLDLRLPGLAGGEAVAAIVTALPGVAVLCLTAEATSELAEAARAAGALSVLEKDAPTREVADAIRSAARG